MVWESYRSLRIVDCGLQRRARQLAHRVCGVPRPLHSNLEFWRYAYWGHILKFGISILGVSQTSALELSENSRATASMVERAVMISVHFLMCTYTAPLAPRAISLASAVFDWIESGTVTSSCARYHSQCNRLNSSLGFCTCEG